MRRLRIASWRTSAAGCVLVLGYVGLCVARRQPIDGDTLALLGVIGAGFLSARDDKVTSEDAGAKDKP